MKYKGLVNDTKGNKELKKKEIERKTREYQIFGLPDHDDWSIRDGVGSKENNTC